jgi:hypothetical protein
MLAATPYKKNMIGTTSSGVSDQLRDIYTPCASAVGMLLHINGKSPIGKH